MTNPNTKDLSHIKFVALAFPGSIQLGINVFLEKGVSHVLSFDQIAPHVDEERAFELIDIFFEIFYEFLLTTDEPLTVVEAYHQTLLSMKANV